MRWIESVLDGKTWNVSDTEDKLGGPIDISLVF